MIDEFRRRPPLGAERLPGRVRWVGVQPGEAAILYRRHRAAAGDAEAAIAVDALRAGVIRPCYRAPFRVSVKPSAYLLCLK